MAALDWKFVSNLNEQRRQQETANPQALVFKNARYFNGRKEDGPADIYIRDGKIVDKYDGAEEIDCNDKFLIPGLIDAHTHPMTPKDLEALTKHGVTTTMSMAGFDAGHMASLKGHRGLVDVLVAGLPAAGPTNKHTLHMPGWPKDEVITKPSQAETFVKKQIEKGADYIKILADIPGLDQDTVTACVDAAKIHGKLTVCHAASLEPARQALRAKAHQLHHSPLDGVFTREDIKFYQETGSIVCPTLSMMEAVANSLKQPVTSVEEALQRPGASLENAKRNVGLLHQVGVTVLCGTDANEAPGTPAKVMFGSSIHHELALLVDSGLSTSDALRSATLNPAHSFGLKDRGLIESGFRADLVLLSGNPLEDISSTMKIEKVWINGVPFN